MSSPMMGALKKLWYVGAHLMDDVEHDTYSPLSPRRSDGSRTKPFLQGGA